MEILIATKNQSKIEQIKDIFSDLPVRVLGLTDVAILGEPNEKGDTLLAKAHDKARFLFDQLEQKAIVLGEETGFFISALGGLPGARAATWIGESASTEEIQNHTLALMEGKSDRSAYFETCVYMVMPDGKEHVFSGRCDGMVLASPRAEPQPSMPYSAIFVPDGSNQVWAEMDLETENSLSQRGRVFRSVRRFLKEYAGM